MIASEVTQHDTKCGVCRIAPIVGFRWGGREGGREGVREGGRKRGRDREREKGEREKGESTA